MKLIVRVILIYTAFRLVHSLPLLSRSKGIAFEAPWIIVMTVFFIDAASILILFLGIVPWDGFPEAGAPAGGLDTGKGRKADESRE
jgi:hypothetical protein